MSSFKRDLFQLGETFYSENAPEVDGINIIGKVSGESFVPDGFSRNKRFYPSSLWEKVINDPDIIQKLSDRNMFGTIGHDLKLDDAAFRNGDFSHVVSGIHIDENGKGMVDYLILNTKAGQNLNTVLRAKSKIYVSSRADGAFVEGKTEKGMPIVDTDRYFLETFDFVLDPGFLQASPALVEAYNNLFPNETIATETNMSDTSETFINALNEKNVELISVSGKLGTAISENQSLQSRCAILESENVTSRQTLESLRDEVSSLRGSHKAYAKLGTVEDISILAGTVSDVLGALDNYDESIPVGEQIEDLEAAAASSDYALSLLASADLAEEGDDIISATERMVATYDHVDQVIDYLENNGLKDKDESLMSVVEKMSGVVSIAESLSNEKKEQRIIALATELGVEVEQISTVSEKSDDEIRILFADVRKVVETNVKFHTYRKIGESVQITPSRGDQSRVNTGKFSEDFNSTAKLAGSFGFSRD